MPRAGFYTVESGKISFRRDGEWYTDDERIANPRIALLFSKSIHRAPDGSYYLQVGDERAAIDVEDTPYVIRSVDDDVRGGIEVTLNDGHREMLDCGNLWSAADNVLYTMVKDGAERARFTRGAYNHLARRIESDESGAFFIRVGDRRARIRTASGGSR
jgi:hypothetical protein